MKRWEKEGLLVNGPVMLVEVPLDGTDRIRERTCNHLSHQPFWYYFFLATRWIDIFWWWWPNLRQRELVILRKSPFFGPRKLSIKASMVPFWLPKYKDYFNNSVTSITRIKRETKEEWCVNSMRKSSRTSLSTDQFLCSTRQKINITFCNICTILPHKKEGKKKKKKGELD